MPDLTPVTLERGTGLLIVDLGVEPADVLRRAQLPPDLFSRDPAHITVDEYFRLWSALEAEVKDPRLPLMLGERLSPEVFQPVVFAALCSPTFAMAVDRIATYKKLVAPMRVAGEKTDDGYLVSLGWQDPGIVCPPGLGFTDLIFKTQIMRIGTRERVVPLRVLAPQKMEPVGDYEAYFGVVPEVGAHGYQLLFSEQDAYRPFLTASESMWKTFEPELQRRLSMLDAEMPITERVRSVLLECIPSGETSIEDTARRLGLSPRTLQRRLKPEGVSFKELVRTTRERLSHHYLTKTTLAYAEISFLVGFDEPSSFFRAFREWTGTTPESVRRA